MFTKSLKYLAGAFIASVLLMGAAPQANAVTYSLNVRLVLQNIHSIRVAQVTCYLYSQINQQGTQLGSRSSSFRQVSANQNNEMVITDVIEIETAGSARSYRCHPKLRLANGFAASVESLRNVSEAESVLEQKGNISPPN